MDELDVVNMDLEGSLCRHDRFTNAEMVSCIDREMSKCSVNAIRYPSLYLGRCYTYYWLGTVISQLTFGLAVDALLRVAGQKPRMIAMYRKIVHSNAALSYFSLNEFPIRTKKSLDVDASIVPGDRKFFTAAFSGEDGFNYERNKYILNVLKGAFKYILNEENSEKQISQRLKKLYIIEIFITAVGLLLFCYVFVKYLSST